MCQRPHTRLPTHSSNLEITSACMDIVGHGLHLHDMCVCVSGAGLAASVLCLANRCPRPFESCPGVEVLQVS